MVTNKIDSTKLPFKLGDIIHSPSLDCTGIIVGYYFFDRFNLYKSPLDYGYVVRRLDNKSGHKGNYMSYKANGERLISKTYNLYCIPLAFKIILKKSLVSFTFKLIKL